MKFGRHLQHKIFRNLKEICQTKLFKPNLVKQIKILKMKFNFRTRNFKINQIISKFYNFKQRKKGHKTKTFFTLFVLQINTLKT